MNRAVTFVAQRQAVAHHEAQRGVIGPSDDVVGVQVALRSAVPAGEPVALEDCSAPDLQLGRRPRTLIVRGHAAAPSRRLRADHRRRGARTRAESASAPLAIRRGHHATARLAAGFRCSVRPAALRAELRGRCAVTMGVVGRATHGAHLGDHRHTETIASIRKRWESFTGGTAIVEEAP